MGTKKIIILATVLLFLIIISGVFFIAYQFGTKTSIQNRQQHITTPVFPDKNNQQVRRVIFINLETGETVELLADGTANYYDKDGKLIRSGRRGFAQTQSILKDLERLVNSGQTIHGYKGYQITIETEQGRHVIDPGSDGNGGTVVDDLFDYIDHTVNPTPRPSPAQTPRPSSTPSNNHPTPSPTPAGASPNPSVKPFSCDDYYKTGKPMKITGTICGPT